MEEELGNYLNAIKEEKDNLVIPENIKKGVTMFGVSGELENISTSKMKVHYLYRGQNKGDCTLITTKNKTILIDLGSTDMTTLISRLEDFNVTKIDYLIVSHFHGDHIASYLSWSGHPEAGYTGDFYGQFEILLESDIDFSNCTFIFPPTPDWSKFLYGDTPESATAVEIDKGSYLYHPGSTYIEQAEKAISTYLEENNYTILRPKDESTLTIDDDVELKFLNCDTSNYTNYYSQLVKMNFNNNAYSKYVTIYNNFSMVVELTHLNNKFLFTGDIELKAQENIANKLSYCDVLKVEHHSVNNFIYNDYFKRLKPKIAVVMETNNIVIDRPAIAGYKSLGTELYTANTSGNVYVTSDITGVHATSSFGQAHTVPINYGLGMAMNGINDIYSLGIPTKIKEIVAGENLNNYLTPGIYCGGDVDIINRPYTGAGFKMIVENGLNGNTIRQTIQHNTTNDLYIRLIRIDWPEPQKFGKWSRVKLLNTELAPDIPKDADLNDYIYEGDYNIINGEVATSLRNIPSTVVNACKLKVEYLHRQDRLVQIIYVANPTCDTYQRIYYLSGWTNWYKYKLENV